MGKLEKEIKILNIDIDETKKKLNTIGAKFIEKKDQKIYTYDVMSIKYRFYEALELLKSNNELLRITSLKKLEMVLDEFEDLANNELLEKIYQELQVNNIKKLFTFDADIILKKINNSKTLINEINNYDINPNKWVRLRQSNDKVELTVKHIYEKNENKIQKVKEIEIKVSDLEETNTLLEELGIVKRNYQEKTRYSYTYKTAEIELDLWPNLEPYMEIECDDVDVMNEIISQLKLESNRIVSMNTEQLYKEKGVDILKMPELKF